MLCFSPVGDKFRIRARQFPALVNCTMFDWFHGWPGEALVSVAQRFLVDVPNLDDVVRENIAYHMAYAHQCVSEASERFKEAFRRFNYTTPKSYLELISLYKTLLQVGGRVPVVPGNCVLRAALVLGCRGLWSCGSCAEPAGVEGSRAAKGPGACMALQLVKLRIQRIVAGLPPELS